MAAIDPASAAGREQLGARLRALNDTLASTPLSGYYWVHGRMLLGWAREGRLLERDGGQVDFFVLKEEEDRLVEGIDALLDAGFRLSRRLPSIDDAHATRWVMAGEDASLQFWLVEIAGDRLRYHSYGHNTDPSYPYSYLHNICEISASSLEEFPFLGRYWLKPADHEAQLTGIYGDWRTSEPDLDNMRSPAIAERRPWDRARSEFE